ncbi:MAG TPA: type II secretion system protein [Verrucomicrobiae bacterium]|nr:type II secretion system protein [Verrucomicrobiae bacterium]
MRFLVTNALPATPLAVEWLEQPDALPAAVVLHTGRAVVRRRSSGSVRSGGCAANGIQGNIMARGFARGGRFSRAFTLLELMVVLAIIGFIAALTLPHVGGYNRANTVSAATRQLLDDVARARARALVNRSTVYMVFLPAYWNTVQALENESVHATPQFTNLLTHQYAAYALYSSRTVGDQPGQHFPHYLTDWQTLPSGVYIWPGQFNPNIQHVNVYTTNTFNPGATNWDVVYPFATNFSFYFPSVNTGVQTNLPYIGFTPQGTLVTPTNQYIMLARGSIFYAENSNGVPVYAPPDVEETPPGNETNNPCMIKIDWLTARATIVQNQFQ